MWEQFKLAVSVTRKGALYEKVLRLVRIVTHGAGVFRHTHFDGLRRFSRTSVADRLSLFCDCEWGIAACRNVRRLRAWRVSGAGLGSEFHEFGFAELQPGAIQSIGYSVGAIQSGGLAVFANAGNPTKPMG